MKVRITNTIEEFKSSLQDKIIGVYIIEISETLNSNGFKLVIVNGEDVKILNHFLEHSELSVATLKFKESILEAIKNKNRRNKDESR